MSKKVKPVTVAVVPVPVAVKPVDPAPDEQPISPPVFDPFSISPDPDPALTPRQSEAINDKAVRSECMDIFN